MTSTIRNKRNATSMQTLHISWRNVVLLRVYLEISQQKKYKRHTDVNDCSSMLKDLCWIIFHAQPPAPPTTQSAKGLKWRRIAALAKRWQCRHERETTTTETLNLQLSQVMPLWLEMTSTICNKRSNTTCKHSAVLPPFCTGRRPSTIPRLRRESFGRIPPCRWLLRETLFSRVIIVLRDQK